MEQLSKHIQELFESTPDTPQTTANFIQQYTHFAIEDILKIEEKCISLRHTHNELFDTETIQGIKTGDSLSIYYTQELIRQAIPDLLLSPEYKHHRLLLDFPSLEEVLKNNQNEIKLKTKGFVKSYISSLDHFAQECFKCQERLNPEDTLETALIKLTNNHNFRLLINPFRISPQDVKAYSNFGKTGQRNTSKEQFLASFSHTDILQTAIDLLGPKKTQTLSQTPKYKKILETLVSLSLVIKIKEQLGN